jgi:hypothetical protein
MKTLIATAVLALASGAASADYLSVFNGEEFYRGQDNDTNIVINPTIGQNNDNLFLEGHYPKVSPSPVQSDRGIADVQAPEKLYIEGHWPV